MANPLKPLSDEQKKLLSLLGWSADTFQQKVVEVQYKKGHSTSRVKKNPNAEYYARTGRVESIKAVVERLKLEPRVYIAIGYVLFERQSHCKSCGRDSVCADCPSLYLMQTDKPGSATRLYQPVTEIKHPNLPRYIKPLQVETLTCLECYNATERREAQRAESPSLAPSTAAIHEGEASCQEK